MKKFFLIALLFAGFIAKGQYFQHIYGTPQNEDYVDGVNTFIQPQGHLMATSGSSLVVTYTDVTGSVSSAPNFNNNYQIISTVTGTALSISTAKVFELENGSGFGVVGLCSGFGPGGSTYSVFYLQLDPSGNPGQVYEYAPVAGSAYTLSSVDAITKSPGTDDIYIAGTADVPVGYYVFALKINSVNGNMVWSSFYDVMQNGLLQKEYIGDIIESPYQPAGVQELALVGGGYDLRSTTQDGFFFRVDANTGTPVSANIFFYGTSSSEDVFTSIEIANSTIGGSNGFIVGGYCNMKGSNDMWLLKLTPTGGVIWSSIYDYSLVPGSNDVCKAVIERLNTSNTYEYYAVGNTAQPGVFNSYDILVIKTGDVGVPNTEFIYDNSGDNDLGFALDKYEGTAADGLSIYGVSYSGAIGGSDAYLVKAYFNGVSGCNESFSTPKSVRGPGPYVETLVTGFDQLQASTLSSSMQGALDVNLCYNSSVTGGSNARVAPEEPIGDKAATIAPNPMAKGTALAKVELEAETPATVEVTIYDMLGKQYYAGNFTLVKGNNQLPVDISSANMAAGMYTVKITGASVNKNILLIVQ